MSYFPIHIFTTLCYVLFFPCFADCHRRSKSKYEIIFDASSETQTLIVTQVVDNLGTRDRWSQFFQIGEGSFIKGKEVNTVDGIAEHYIANYREDLGTEDEEDDVLLSIMSQMTMDVGCVLTLTL